MGISSHIFDKIKNRLILIFLLFEVFLIVTIFLGFYTFSRLEGDASHIHMIVSLREKIVRAQFDLNSYFTLNEEKYRANAFKEMSSFNDLLGRMEGETGNDGEILSQINENSRRWENFKLTVDNAVSHHKKIISLKEKVLKMMMGAISANKTLGDRLVETEDENYGLYGEIIQDITRKIIRSKTYLDDYTFARNQDSLDEDLINITVSLEKIMSYVKGFQYGLEKHNIFSLDKDDLESLGLLAKLSERLLEYQNSVNKIIAERDVLISSVQNMERQTNELIEGLQEAENLFKGYSEEKTATKKRADFVLLILALTMILFFFKLLMNIKRIVGDMEQKIFARTRELSKANSFIENIIASMIDTLIVLNPDETIQRINFAALGLLGYKEEELRGRSMKTILGGESPFTEKGGRNGFLKKGFIHNMEKKYLSKDGGEIPVSFSCATMRDEDGNIQGIVCVAKDIREEKKLREQLFQSEKLKSIGTFVSGIAHELNNPLTSVLGFSEILLENENLPLEVKQDLRIISEQTKRCGNIVQNLLDFSRGHKPGKTPISIDKVITGTLRLHEYRLRADNIRVNTHFAPDLPLVMGEMNQLQQVFMNLILNAYHAMFSRHEKGIFSIATKKSGGMVRIMFENDGPHIPEEVLGKIFDPFFTTKDVGKGTGLGLSISFGIIKDHGGNIWVENILDSSPGFAEGTGVRFFIELPISQSETVGGKTGGMDEILPKGVNVLVVEDEEHVRHYISRILSKEGCDVLTAINGEEAIKYIQEKNFDLIFSDIKMPEMDGYGLGRWINENKPESMPRLVFLTGLIDRQVEDFCSRYHCNSLVKPINKEEIFRIIRKVVGKG